MANARKIIAPEASKKHKSTVLVDGKSDPNQDVETPEHRRAMSRHLTRADLVSIADQVAGDAMFFRNYRWPDANRIYPDDVDAMMRFVSRYYPHATNGPLYIDEPANLREVNRCEEKSKHMKKLKLRYVVINKAYELPDEHQVHATTLAEAMEQLDL